MRIVEKMCSHCGQINRIAMTHEQYIKYTECSELVQNIFPELSPQKREILITGICPQCWEKIFPPEEE